MPEGKVASMFEVTMITESANHKRYRVSLRSSSKRVPSNPSPNGVRLSAESTGELPQSPRRVYVFGPAFPPPALPPPGGGRSAEEGKPTTGLSMPAVVPGGP